MISNQELLTLIEQKEQAETDFAELVKERKDLQIQEALNKNRKAPKQTYSGYGHVMEVLGDEAGAQLLDTLEQLGANSSPIKWAFRLLERGVLDLGSSETRKALDKLALAGIIPENSAKLLKDSALVDDPIPLNQISEVLNGRGKNG